MLDELFQCGGVELRGDVPVFHDGQEQRNAQEQLSVQVLDDVLVLLDEQVLIRGREQHGVEELHAQ